MIFATVGTQLPFPRLLEALRQLVEIENCFVFAQTIDTEYEYHSKGKLVCKKNLTPTEYDEKFSNSRLVISHAGIGSIISASRFQKPIILMPRRQEFKEHRNNHQVETAHHFSEAKGIYIASNVNEVISLLKRDLLTRPVLNSESSQLILGIRSFIWSADR